MILQHTYFKLLMTVVLLAVGVRMQTAQANVVEHLVAHEAKSGLVTQAEMAFAEKWVQGVINFAKGNTGQDSDMPIWLSTKLPFSFVYDGQPSDEILPSWVFTVEELTQTEAHNQSRLIWTDPSTGLRIVCDTKQYKRYPVFEWLLHFENTGTKATGTIEDTRALRLSISHEQKKKGYTLHACRGSQKLPEDFMPVTWQSDPDQESQSFVLGDAPSSLHHIPFWNMETPDDRGVMVGLGWTGAWNAKFDVRKQDMNVTAGMPRTHFFLHPGEKVRSPRVLLLFWQGESLHGHNMLRRLLYHHYIRPVQGSKQKPLVTVNTCFTHHGKGGYLHQASEATLLPLVEPFIDLGIEALVIDAGWYECDKWLDIFDWPKAPDKSKIWRASSTRYPNGFQSLSEPLRKAGVNFGLWFWPESLGRLRPEAKRAEILEHFDRCVKEYHITLYRTDGAVGDLTKIFEKTDDPNRAGIRAIKSYEGLYTFWDQVTERYPDLIMEGCAGGGRRVDLETIQRFSWFQKSDLWYNSKSDQCSLYGGNLFLPGGYLNIPTEGVDNYSVWSSFAGQFCLGWHPIDDDFDMDQARKQVALYKEIRHLLHGDFYPQTECSLEEPWIGYQFHRSDLNEGLVLLFRRDTPYSAMDIKLDGLEPTSDYSLHFHGCGKIKTFSGQKLAQSIAVSIDQNPGAELIIYGLNK